MLFSSETLQARRQKVVAAWTGLLPHDHAILIHSGTPIQKPGGLDQRYPFLPHPIFFWLTARRRAHEVLVYTHDDGWVEFQDPPSAEEKLWDGGEADEVPVGKVRPLNELSSFLKQKKFLQIHHFGQSAEALLSAETKSGLWWDLKVRLDHTRRIKDAAEVELIEKIAGITARGYEKLKSFIRPGVSEREIQIEFEAEILRAGAHRTPYSSIVGSGPNAAILHAKPTSRVLRGGELVLIDAAADVADYCVDVTRVFAADGRFESRQQALYDLVLKAQLEAISISRAGVQWKDVHLTTARIIAEGLKGLGILSCSAEDALESAAISLFYPHGVGHLVGLRVRDTGCEENLHPRPYAGVTLRVDLRLEENYLITVEPGCYFQPILLAQPERRQKLKDLVRWSEVDKWLDVGGVRIEDNILIQRTEPQVLTREIPK